MPQCRSFAYISCFVNFAWFIDVTETAFILGALSEDADGPIHMKTLVIGAGIVGINIADRLVEEGHDVTLIEPDSMRLKEVTDQLDIGGICTRLPPEGLAKGGY